jgi:hypothetical protein
MALGQSAHQHHTHVGLGTLADGDVGRIADPSRLAA